MSQEVKQIAFGVTGAIVGSLFGSVGTGFALGMTLGGLLFPPEISGSSQGKLGDLRLTGSAQGVPIPDAFGRMKLGGNIIWAANMREHVLETPSEGKGSQPVTNFTYDLDFAVMICQGPIQRLARIWANKEVIYDNTTGTPTYASWLSPSQIAIYDGDNDQEPDPTMEASLGVDNVPGYRGKCYVVFNQFYLDRFSNTFPTLEFEVWAGSPCDGEQMAFGTEAIVGERQTLSTVCKAVFRRAGVPLELCDFTDIEDLLVTGLVISSRTEVRNFAEMISGAYLVDFVEVDGKVFGIKRSKDSLFTLSNDDIGAATDGEPPTQPMTVTRAMEFDLPRTVEISCYNGDPDHPDINFETLIQRHTIPGMVSANQASVSIPIVFTPEESRELARAIILAAKSERISCPLTLPLKYIGITAGDRFKVPVRFYESGEECLVPVRVKSVVVGASGHLEVGTVISANSIYDKFYTTNNEAVVPHEEGGGIPEPNETLWALFDVPAVNDYDADFFMIYGAACGPNPGWTGIIARAGDNPSVDAYSYNPAYNGYHNLVMKAQAYVGVANTLLGSPNASEYWDRINTVRVTMTHGTLSSATEEEVVNGMNHAILDKEIIAFKTATLVSPGVYDLSMLLRGRRGTEQAMSDHAVGDKFVLISSLSRRTALNATEVGATRDVYGYDIGVSYQEPPAYITMAFTGASRKPYAPCQFMGERDGSDHLFISWVRRVRKDGELRDYDDAPLDETTEQYRLEILNISGDVMRSVDVTDPEFIYTAAMQIEDFGSTQAYVYATVCQLSSVAGEGWKARKTL